jgi:hypothetical protein
MSFTAVQLMHDSTEFRADGLALKSEAEPRNTRSQAGAWEPEEKQVLGGVKRRPPGPERRMYARN